MLNRSAVIILYKQPFVDWINTADPDTGRQMTLDRANDEATVYLVEAEDQEELEVWLKLNYKIPFEAELQDWYTAPALWPQERSYEIFKEWCSCEFHSVIIDTGSTPLEDDES